MGIVLASTAISLDGFVAGPNHEIDWVFDHHFLPRRCLCGHPRASKTATGSR
jgi:hypothetical protein